MKSVIIIIGTMADETYNKMASIAINGGASNVVWCDPEKVEDRNTRAKITTRPDEYEAIAVGGLIANRLKELDMTQRELAEITGITEVSISRYIKGDREPRGSTLYEIAKALKVDLNYFQDAFNIPFM